MTFVNASNKKLKSFEKLINTVLHNGYLVFLYDYKAKQIIGILSLNLSLSKDEYEDVIRKTDGYKVDKIGRSNCDCNLWFYMEKE